MSAALKLRPVDSDRPRWSNSATTTSGSAVSCTRTFSTRSSSGVAAATDAKRTRVTSALLAGLRP